MPPFDPVQGDPELPAHDPARYRMGLRQRLVILVAAVLIGLPVIAALAAVFQYEMLRLVGQDTERG